MLPYFPLPAFVSITGYYYNNRSNSNEVNKSLIASTKNKSLWYWKDHSTPPPAPPQKGKYDGKVQNHSEIHDHDHTAHSSPEYLH